MTHQPIDTPNDRKTAPGWEGRRMPAQARKARITENIREVGYVSVAEIAILFDVSTMTIRRDLVDLEREGLLSRTFGGAVSLEGDQQYPVDQEEPAFDARLRRNRSAKERIAAEAAKLVSSHQSIALDVGTSTFLLAAHLVGKPNITMFTNSLRIASFTSLRGCDIYVPGGQVRREELSVWSPQATSEFNKFWFAVAFIGVSGITEDGFYDYSMEDTEVKRVYISRASCKIVLCDSSKFQRISLIRIAPLSDIDMLITNTPPQPDLAAALTEAGVEIRIADSGPPPFSSK